MNLVVLLGINNYPVDKKMMKTINLLCEEIMN